MAKKATTRKAATKKTPRKKATRTPAKQVGTGKGKAVTATEGRDANGRFLPGYSGNPAGPGPGVRVAHVIQRTLADRPELVQSLVDSWLSKAAEDVQFAKMILERNEGKVADVLAASVASASLTPEQTATVAATLRRLAEHDPNG